MSECHFRAQISGDCAQRLRRMMDACGAPSPSAFMCLLSKRYEEEWLNYWEGKGHAMAESFPSLQPLPTSSGSLEEPIEGF